MPNIRTERIVDLEQELRRNASEKIVDLTQEVETERVREDCGPDTGRDGTLQRILWT